MRYGIPLIPIIPMRKTPAESSEMVSQVLFGEIFQILEKEKNWSYIKLEYDGYEGWIDSKTYGMLATKPATAPRVIKDKLIWHESANGKFPLPMGSELHENLPNIEPYMIQLAHPLPKENNAYKLTEMAKAFLNTPYLWGGRSAFGIDCSGFTQVLMKAQGITLPRDSSQQALKGTTVEFVKDALPGDLAFFDNQEGIITHVGVLLNPSEIIHASGMVQINRFDHQGIFHPLSQKYTHKLRIIKRLIPQL